MTGGRSDGQRNLNGVKVWRMKGAQVEGMMFVAATMGPFLSKLIKTNLGSVFVFTGGNSTTTGRNNLNYFPF